MEIKVKVKVTYYNMGLFRATFESFFRNYKVLHASLSPKFNLEQVFKAGEGAGKSGSFFFFSHDKKFIIKTMTDEELEEMLAGATQQKIDNQIAVTDQAFK